MRILHISYICPPILEVADGITNVVYNTTKGLARRGHQVTVYTSNLWDLHGKTSLSANHLVVNGVDVYYSRSLRIYKSFIITPSIIPLLSKNMDDFDVIHIHDCRSFQGIATYIFARIKKVPYVFQPHGSFSMLSDGSATKRIARIALDELVSGEIVRNASKIIALSRAEAEQYMALGVPAEKTTVIPNGIDLSEYHDLPPRGSFKKKFSIDDDEKIVLYVGRIHESKGLDLLARAFKIVLENLNNVRLVLVGSDDGYASTFSRLASELRIRKKIFLTGFMEERNKLEALVDSDVFVTPRFRGFPITFLEACLAKCPIVTASDELDWINNNVGYVTENSATALAEAISNILQNEGVQKTFRNNCRRVIKNFDISAITTQLESAYKSVIR